ncbi:MAG: ubiquinol-cytochrome c reductase cytochrome b subunit [Acidipropionibacterium acidipropionici]|jgi:ubiquinol-cytochrome c reductase cytochrome b subunit|uniref:Cytochrome bc1 complex cytochrome b subunit n=1 Tax=Acidipropionibacterium acidipropionici (strain ATCC 4875 / DSM 20272 / JCM 6432 / NBRC 12425 / NCIMB 8070 / 4) TaxID=1171373 RepID=K7RVN8_ACIA4|nr:ubiquinol-cytochrome c reductase cytochrome b subunit [Acidipropionibacterium acidipropionici]AFV89048.1 Cytochrome b/b6 family protein [Acidipropionibacterium acidipropionici ATCC 4875]ALN16372.1 ubiquinol-cytochrome c reductase cytochrome b subunit [Acidipropionibacterium acidipropionici]APZ10576.1 ubiquinol-cytochrome c reductase cytochrome b subunit [Acidipropionibacterium acidipropionici]MDN6555662.1 ubiquinol-cytochrome c reductase cytochrome b subunit [Acidipropionibacterium acidiprop
MARPTGTADTSPAVESQVPDDAAPKKSSSGPLIWADDRLGLAKLGKAGLRKVFPDHWSFLLGEIALYSFIVLLITGVFLTIWFKPSMAEIDYQGSYQLLRGVPMSEAFASTLDISFDIRGGLLVRQIHHWAALLFVAAAMFHMLRVFFTGAFRKPREINWLIGVGLFMMAMIEGFAGYSLPDDLLSGTGLRFADGLMRSIPLIGTWVEFFVFNGEFPGTAIVPRLYMVHILLVPALLLGLIAAHISLVVYHKHTQYPGPGHTEKNVVGYPMFPVYMAKAGGFFFVVFGVITLMATFMQINPVWKYGPYNPAQVTAGSQPDWYMGWLEGAVRIMPNWEWHIGHTTWSWNIFLPGVGLMGILAVILVAWPFVERWITGDTAEHHILDRPRNVPTRTALGVAAMTGYAMFQLAGGNDIIATHFHLSLNAITYFMRAAVFVAPVIAYHITKRICVSLQRADLERLEHGSPSGEIVRSPDGGFVEKHEPLSQEEAWRLTQHKEYPVLDATVTGDEGIPVRGGVSRRRARLLRWFVGSNVAKPTADQIKGADGHRSVEGAEARPEVESSRSEDAGAEERTPIGH